jgi:hypothetical protein
VKAKFYTYRNLPKGGFSTKHHGVVNLRFEIAVVQNPKFQVSKASSERAVNEGRRNVHAFVVSDDLPEKRTRWFQPPHELVEVKYNPFKMAQFTADGKPVYEAEVVYFVEGRAYIPKTT